MSEHTDYLKDELDHIPVRVGFIGKSSVGLRLGQLCTLFSVRVSSSIVLATRAASRGTAIAGTKKEKTIRLVLKLR